MAPDIPATAPDNDFPLKAHLLGVRWSGAGADYHGFGIGNLTEADQTHGFDFSFECSVPFDGNTDPAVVFQAAWRKPGYEMEILLARVGQDRQDVCRLKVVMLQQAIDPAQVRLSHAGPGPLPGPRWQAPDAPFTDPDPDYPVRLHVITSTRRDTAGGSQGWGTANLLDPPVRGADYTFSCGYGFLPSTMPGDVYQGHWVKPDQELEILTQRMGTDKVDRCRLRLTVLPQPYSNRSAASQPASRNQQPVMIQRSPPQP
jgi:hypothetical protein